MNTQNICQWIWGRIGVVVVIAALLLSAGLMWSGGFVIAQGTPEEEAAAETQMPEAEPLPAHQAPSIPDNGDALQVVGTYPLEGQALREQFVLYFNKPVDWNSIDDPILYIEGTVYRGDAQLEDGSLPIPRHGFGREELDIGTNHLGFSRYQSPPNSLLTVTLADGLQSVDGHPLHPEQREFFFTNVNFQPTRVFLHERKADVVRLGVSFPVPVDTSMVEEHLSITTERNTPAPFEIEQAEQPNLHIVTIRDHTDWPVWLVFDQGLRDRSGQLAQHEAARFQYPTELRLQVSRVRWESFTPDSQEIAMRFSQPVEPEALQRYLRIVDTDTGSEIPYYTMTYEPATEHLIGINLDMPGAIRMELIYEEGLTGVEGAQLRNAYRTTLEHQPTPLRIQSHWWRTHPPEEGLTLQLRLSRSIDPPEFLESIRIEPEVPNLRVEPEGYRSYAVRGDWRSLQTYRISVDEGITYGDGYLLDSPLEITVRTPEVPALVRFGYEGQFYFPRRAGIPLTMSTRNVSEVDLTLHRLLPSNLPIALDDIRRDEATMRFIRSWSEELASTSIDITPRRDEVVDTEVDLESLFLTNRRGVFALQGRDADGRQQSTKIIVWTDLGVLAHWQRDELVLFAHDLFSLEPRAYADVRVYSDKNQLLGQGRTCDDGMARLSNFNPSHGAPKVVVVEHNEDFTFLELQPREDDPVAYTAGMPTYDRKGYDAFIYADRELYRPGETAHIQWSVRTNYGDALAEAPLLLRIRRPNRRILVEETVMLSEWGTGGYDFETQQPYQTGQYTVELLVPGNDRPIGAYTLNLEDFVPNRIKVDIDAPEDPYVAGETYPVSVKAEHLFGAPTADRRSELAVALSKTQFESDKWPEYQFGNDDDYTDEVLQLGETQTDEEGKAQFEFKYDKRPEVTFPLKVALVGRVFELGGRAVTGTEERILLPSAINLGVNASPAVDGSSVDVSVVAITPDEAPADLDTVTITLERVSWNYYVRRYHSHHEPNWDRTFETVESRDVPMTDGVASTSFDIPRFGDYRIRVHSEATHQFSTVSLFRTWDRIMVRDNGHRPSLITLTTDKDRYAVGDVAEVTIESPFDGTGIVVLQGESIQKMVSIPVEDGVGTAQFDISRAQFPNVWVEATVIHAIHEDRSQVYPFSSFAMTPIAVDDPARNVEVSFPDLPDEIRPAGAATFAIETRDASGAPLETEVTLAAVDEGIHLVTDYTTPDPYRWLTRFRRPDYRRAHYYDRVAYDFGKPTPGGGMDALLDTRAAAPDENWIRPVALWSGAVRTDADGRAEVTFNVPEFTGQLRLVAVAVNADSMGAEDAHLYVRRPYMMRIGMPRFLLPNDSMQARATVFNSTDEEVTARVRWTGSGTLEGSAGSRELEVGPQGEVSLLADFKAAQAVGQGSIRWETEILDTDGNSVEHLIEDMPLPVRPPAAYQSHYELVRIEPGETREFRNTEFIDDERAEVGLVVGANPLLRLTRALDDVVSYPFGCLEQQVSRMFPLYLVRRNAGLFEFAAEDEAIHPAQMTLDDAETFRVYIEAGIQQLFAMQTPEGGLASWPGRMTTYEYGSVYALHFLTLVKNDREYEVPEAGFRALQDYVRRIARDWTGDQQRDHYLRAYAIYTLALDGDVEAIDQIGRFDTITIPQSARYLLAAALARTTQDEARINLYLSTRPSEPYAVSEPGGTLITDIRNKAVRLMALEEMDGDPETRHALADELIRHLEESERRDRWRWGRMTTQETAFVAAALARYLEGIEADIEQAEATITAPDDESTLTGRDVYHHVHRGPGGVFIVANSGVTPLYVIVTTRGVPPTPNLEPVHEGLSVERSFYTRRGVPLEGDDARTFEQPESYVVGITIKPERVAENVVVVDLLPAGFEIENPRLDADAIPGADFDDAVSPNYVDMRDDRLILAFDELSADKYTFYYVVRAVTPGAFQHPPLDAECMYDPAVRGATAPSSIQVK